MWSSSCAVCGFNPRQRWRAHGLRAEPVVEADRAQGGVVGHECALAQLRAKVARARICDHWTSIVVCAEVSSDEFVHGGGTQRFASGNVKRCTDPVLPRCYISATAPARTVSSAAGPSHIRSGPRWRSSGGAVHSSAHRGGGEAAAQALDERNHPFEVGTVLWCMGEALVAVLMIPPLGQPNVNEKASTPGSRNSISNCLSAMRLGCRIS